MKLIIKVLTVLLFLCGLLCGCEYDQKQMLCTIINNEKYVEANSFDKSRFSFLPFDISGTEISELDKDSYLKLITNFIKYSYRMNYTFSDVGMLEDSYEMMSSDLSNTLRDNHYLEDIISDVRELKMNIDISNIEIYDLCCDFKDKGSMIFATINLTIDGDTDNYIMLHPELYGGDNLIDMAFYVTNENNQSMITSWYESTRDPHQVRYFSSDGIIMTVELTHSNNSNMYNFE